MLQAALAAAQARPAPAGQAALHHVELARLREQAEQRRRLEQFAEQRRQQQQQAEQRQLTEQHMWQQRQRQQQLHQLHQRQQQWEQQRQRQQQAAVAVREVPPPVNGDLLEMMREYMNDLRPAMPSMPSVVTTVLARGAAGTTAGSGGVRYNALPQFAQLITPQQQHQQLPQQQQEQQKWQQPPPSPQQEQQQWQQPLPLPQQEQQPQQQQRQMAPPASAAPQARGAARDRKTSRPRGGTQRRRVSDVHEHAQVHQPLTSSPSQQPPQQQQALVGPAAATGAVESGTRGAPCRHAVAVKQETEAATDQEQQAPPAVSEGTEADDGTPLPQWAETRKQQTRRRPRAAAGATWPACPAAGATRVQQAGADTQPSR